LITYLYGSIPFGYWLALKIKKINVRKLGSGNIGATNITRILGVRFGLISFLFDFSKGVLPFLVGSFLFPGLAKDLLLLIASFGIIGHDYSPFLAFQGGKGIGTTFGLALVFHWSSTLIAASLWISIILITGYVSLASILTISIVPVLYIIFGLNVRLPYSMVFGIFYSLLGIFQHRNNIKRLIHKCEKVSFKKNFLHNV